MSLPPAKKQTTEKAAAGSVINPLDKAAKEADVDRKIRFYGVVEAFRRGRMPDNDQIDTTLRYVLNNSPVDVNQLSPDGRKLINDTKDIIETARLIVAQKNADELFQNFVWHTRDVDRERIKKDPSPSSSDVKPDQDRDDAVHHLRTLLNLVATNSEVRKLLSDFGFIGRDLLATAATKAADEIRPTPEQLRGVDESGPQDQFVTKDGKKVQTTKETPVLEAKLPGTDATVTHHPSMPEPQVNQPSGQTKPASDALAESKVEAQKAKADVKESASREASDVADTAADENLSAEVKKKGLKERMKGLRSGFSEKVPQEHKDKANEYHERTRKFLMEEYFPEERRDQFIYRGKKVIIECQKHDDYQESIRWLLSAFERYHSHARSTAKNANGHGKDVFSKDPGFKQATSELRTLLERFANGKSMGGIIDAINALYDDADRDEELRNWFKSVDGYTRKVLLEAGFVLEPICNQQGREIRESGRKFYDDKYKSHFDNLFNNIGEWFKQMGEDPLNKRFGEDWARLTHDLLFDADGSLKFKADLWADVRKVIVPTLAQQVGYVPIPRIEYTDDALDLVIENLTLSGKNLFPNIVTLEARNYFKFSPYNVIKDESEHEFTFHLGQMQADMRDVAFYFKKKGGLKITDSGLADILVGGEGVSVTAHIVSAGKDRSSVFKVKTVNVKVDNLKFSIRDSKHDLLYKTLKPLASGLVKKQIQKAVKDGVRTGLEYLDGQLVSVRDRMEAAKVERAANNGEGKSRTTVLQETFKKKKEETTSTASTISSQAARRNSQFKVVAKRDSALLPDTGHPAGWVNRADEKVEAAATGDSWKSPAFNIVPTAAPATAAAH